MYYFCTYFDKNYLTNGLALYRSLKGCCSDFYLWVLCMDQETHQALTDMALPGVGLIALEDFERGDKQLQEAKKNRTQFEYCLTCTSSLPLFILNNFPDVDLITYIDADVYFFNDPASIFKDIADYSIGIVEHRFSPQNKEKVMYGIYNVGWLSFRRDENAMDCLNWWRRMCNEWCYVRVEKDRFADQKYLDTWPARFKRVVVLKNKGINLAPWNIANYKIHTDRKNIYIDGELLIFFHFHGLRYLARHLYGSGLGYYRTRMNKTIRHFIYSPYIEAIIKAGKDLSVRFGSTGYLKEIGCMDNVCMRDKVYVKIKQFLYAIYHVIIFRDYIVASEDQGPKGK